VGINFIYHVYSHGWKLKWNAQHAELLYPLQREESNKYVDG